jgi:hypothetical protein
MESSWEVQEGHLVCHWSEAGQRVPYNASWMHETTQIHGSYLPPLPDFASHSPFGGPSWFERYFTKESSSQ